jgi:hypothetical protein
LVYGERTLQLTVFPKPVSKSDCTLVLPTPLLSQASFLPAPSVGPLFWTKPLLLNFPPNAAVEVAQLPVFAGGKLREELWEPLSEKLLQLTAYVTVGVNRLIGIIRNPVRAIRRPATRNPFICVQTCEDIVNFY